VHASVESTIGSGRGDDGGRLGCTGRDFIVFEPAANVEINVAHHFRIAEGVGYRFALARSGDGPSSLGMSSAVARSALVLGSF
jgi:hypothetical protein